MYKQKHQQRKHFASRKAILINSQKISKIPQQDKLIGKRTQYILEALKEEAIVLKAQLPAILIRNKMDNWLLSYGHLWGISKID